MEDGFKQHRINELSFSVHYLRMLSNFTGEVMATGTGFIYEFEDTLYLITNGHNITGINPSTGKKENQKLAFPGKIRTLVRIVPSNMPNMMGGQLIGIDLYEDEDFKDPKWYIHPTHGYLVDVVAIPIIEKKDLPHHVKLYPINKFEFDDEFFHEAGDDVFILGYPFDITGGKDLPLWKRGTISTEPSIEIDNLPKYLVDTASRSGMSGAPVIMYRTGIHIRNPGKMSKDDLLGRIRKFVGVYSGRIVGKNDLEAQLGIVWKEHVIEEILTAKVKGTIEFQSM